MEPTSLRRCCLALLTLITACGGSGDFAGADPSDAAGDAAYGDGALGDATSPTDTPEGIDAGPETSPVDGVSSEAPVTTDATMGDGACVALGSFCSTAPCCEATCDPTSHLCTSPPGGYCDGTQPNPDAYCPWGYVCEKGTSKCVKMTCVDEHWMSVCSSLPGLDCCDPKTKCTKLPGPFHSETCCAPDGTTLPSSESYKCCSGAITSTGDAGEIKCIPRPPPP